ncbi:MAG: hypothetical protein ACLU4J_09955 [Butyricimonas paravirosa]
MATFVVLQRGKLNGLGAFQFEFYREMNDESFANSCCGVIFDDMPETTRLWGSTPV